MTPTRRDLNELAREEPLTDEVLDELEEELLDKAARMGVSGGTLIQKYQLWQLIQEVRLSRKQREA